MPSSQNVWEIGPFVVTGACPLRHWSVLCSSTALTNLETGDSITPDRVELVGLANGPALSLAQPVPVLVGGIGTPIGPTGTASFRLRVTTDWMDPAGNYSATLHFDYLASP